jgi:pimeloyl-ACP methyl ester carboxylesterase
VLLHGNGTMTQDFETSGLIDIAASHYRVIAFDRPGYGHSSRPRGRLWTAGQQADLLHEALRRMGVENPIILGHSWGSLIALAYGLRHPESVAGLVLASGYYFPTARVDAAVLVGPAVPVLGDVIRYTVSPLLGRLMWPGAIRKMFAPRPVSGRFATGFPDEMSLRPSQIRASAAEAGMMVPTAGSTYNRYPTLRIPVSIIAGAEDRIVDIEAQSQRLHRDIPHSSFHAVAGAGHMVHHADPHAVLRAIDSAAGS